MDSDSTSTSSQTEMSSSDTTASTHTSQSTSSPVKPSRSFQMTLPPRESIPRKGSIGTSSPTPSLSFSPMVSTPSSPRISELSETTTSSLLSSSPSDTTNSTQDTPTSPSDSKTDILLSMKMEVVNFSQNYYLKRATESGSPLQVSIDKYSVGEAKGEQFLRRHVHAPPYTPRSRLNPRTSEFTPRFGTTSVTIAGRATHNQREKRGKQPSSKRLATSAVKSSQRGRTVAPVAAAKEAEKRVGDVWDGYLVEAFGNKKAQTFKEWEWDEPVLETVSEIVRSEDEDVKQVKGVEISPGRSLGDAGVAEKSQVSTGDGNGNGINGIRPGDGGGGGGGDEGGSGRGGGSNGEYTPGSQAAAPRGKSWMIVTKNMAREYSP